MVLLALQGLAGVRRRHHLQKVLGRIVELEQGFHNFVVIEQVDEHFDEDQLGVFEGQLQKRSEPFVEALDVVGLKRAGAETWCILRVPDAV